MNSLQRQAEIKSLIDELQKKHQQIEEARKKDLILEEMRKLYLEMKNLNQKLQQCLQESNLEIPNDQHSPPSLKDSFTKKQ